MINNADPGLSSFDQMGDADGVPETEHASIVAMMVAAPLRRQRRQRLRCG